MDFFRKHFTTVLFGSLALIALVYVGTYFSNTGSNSQVYVPQIVTPEEVQPYEPPFTHEGNLSFFKKGDGKQIITLEIEFARTEAETQLGLMSRKSMAENRGMLFVFPDEQMRSFWMRNTYIPLDIIYLNKDKQIVSIAKNAEPMTEVSRPSEGPALYVLEVNAGLSDRWGLEKGDYMTFESLID